jgi:hypothetical protein
MKRLLRCALAAFVLLVSHESAFAQATRTWVSGVGDDANPCSRTAPCKTFAGAISKTAAGGVISVLDPGGFGAVTITKAITIDGGGIEGSIIGAGTNGVNVNVAATDHVVLRNLAINGGGSGLTGIRVLNVSGHVTVQNVTVSGFDTGLEFNSTGKLYVHDSFFHDNQDFGVVVKQGRGTLDRVRFDSNGFDALRSTDGAKTTVRGSTAAGHTNVAFSAVGAGSALSVDDCVATNNAYGMGSMWGAAMQIGNSMIVSNTTQGVYVDGPSSLVSLGGNRVASNPTNGTFTSTTAPQ